MESNSIEEMNKPMVDDIQRKNSNIGAPTPLNVENSNNNNNINPGYPYPPPNYPYPYPPQDGKEGQNQPPAGYYPPPQYFYPPPNNINNSKDNLQSNSNSQPLLPPYSYYPPPQNGPNGEFKGYPYPPPGEYKPGQVPPYPYPYPPPYNSQSNQSNIPVTPKNDYGETPYYTKKTETDKPKEVNKSFGEKIDKCFDCSGGKIVFFMGVILLLVAIVDLVLHIYLFTTYNDYSNIVPFIDDSCIALLGIGGILAYCAHSKNLGKCLGGCTVAVWFVGFGLRGVGMSGSGDHIGLDFGFLVIRTFATFGAIPVFFSSSGF